MMLGWRKGHSVGRYVIVDPVFPWPSLHHGREALRLYTQRQTAARNRLGDEGLMRMPAWGLKCAVKECGDITINVWPAGKRGAQREWTAADAAWRPALGDLARFIAADLKCEVRLNWMPGGAPFTKELTVPSLRNVPGFYGWRKGEKEPKPHIMRALIRDGILAGRAQGSSVHGVM